MTPARPAYRELLARRLGRVGSVLCLGLDPEPGSLPRGFPPTVEGIERFGRLLLDVAAPYAAAVKPNLAFYEALGSAGLACLERLRAQMPDDLPVILDAKRGDIGSTSERHAAALFDHLAADAVTLSPYLGADAIAPHLERAGRGVYVLCRTSNPGAGEFQALPVADAAGGEVEPLYLRVARRVGTWGRPTGAEPGLVVGATATDELCQIREAVPELPFLVPGVGVQGGAAEDVLVHGPATAGPWSELPGGGLLVNVSRGIASTAVDADDPAEALGEAARTWAARLAVLA